MIIFIALVILAHQLLLYVKRRRFDPFSFSTFVDMVICFIFIYCIESDHEISIYTSEHPSYMLTIIAGILALYAGMHWPGSRPAGPPLSANHESVQLQIGWLWRGFAVYLLVAYFLISEDLSLSGMGWLESILSERLSYYLGGGILLPAIWSELLIAAFGPSLMLLVFKLQTRRWLTAALIYGLLFLVALSTFHTRLGLLILLAFPVVYFHYRIKAIPWPAFGALFGAFLVLMFVLNQWRTEGARSVRSDVITPQSLVAEVDSEMGAETSPIRGLDWIMIANQKHTLRYEYGMICTDLVINLVPRSLWPGKPITSFEGRWTEKITGQSLGSGVAAWTFTAWGEGLAQFGVPGLVLNLFLYGLLVSRLLNWLEDRPIMLFVGFQYSVLAATFLRAGFEAIAFYSGVFGVPTIACFWLITRSRRTRGRSPALMHQIRGPRSTRLPVFPHFGRRTFWRYAARPRPNVRLVHGDD